MLGALGVIHAFDRYFISGARYILGVNSFSKKNISTLYEYAVDQKKEIELSQSYIIDETGFWYPPMKILDMYFWQIGFNYFY